MICERACPEGEHFPKLLGIANILLWKTATNAYRLALLVKDLRSLL
jgi:hypothetical protein